MHLCDRRLRRHSTLAGICWALNYFLLDAWMGAALSCVSAARSGTASLVHRHDLRLRAGVCLMFVACSCATALLTWQDWTTLLPVASSMLTTCAVFFLTGKHLRAALLVAALLWTQNVLALQSPEQIVGNLLGITAAGIGLWRSIRLERAVRSAGATRARDDAEGPIGAVG